MHAAELVRDACRGGARALVVYSGDGGYNEALNGLHGDVPIGFLPGGGTSVLPRALGLSHDPIAAAVQIAEALEQGRTRRITLGRVNGRRFAFSAGLGLDAAAVRRVDEMGRRYDGKRPGDLAFALAVVRVLAANRGHLEPTLEVKDVGRAAFAFVANGSPYTYAKRIALPIAPRGPVRAGPRFRRSRAPQAPLASCRARWRCSPGTCNRGPVLYGHDPRPPRDHLRPADAPPCRRRGSR